LNRDTSTKSKNKGNNEKSQPAIADVSTSSTQVGTFL
jgi:hypothetical protein